VDRAEDAAQNLAVVGTLLQRDQVAVQAVEVLVALDQKLFDNVVGIIHSEIPLHRRTFRSLEPAKAHLVLDSMTPADFSL
jgi:hypothetical protein